VQEDSLDVQAVLYALAMTTVDELVPWGWDVSKEGGEEEEEEEEVM